MNLINKIKEILFEQSEIEFAFLFGSFARNEATGISDIDIAIYQKTKKTEYETKVFELEIEALLTERIPDQKFDVRSLNYAPIIVIGKIINEGKLIFARNESFLVDYIVQNRIKYMDYMIVYKPLFEQRYRELLDG